jgi:tetratricopeptide (TPR) repeat protein
MSEHELWNELGNLYFMSGAYDQAIHAYHRSIQLDNNFGRPYSNLALAYVQQGKYEEAVQLYRRSLELLADNEEKAISWNRLGNVYRHLKEYKEAVVAYQQADELHPESSEGREEPGQVLYGPSQASSPGEDPTMDRSDAASGTDQDFVSASKPDEEPELHFPDEISSSWVPADSTAYEQESSSAAENTSSTTWTEPNLDEIENPYLAPEEETEVYLPDLNADDLTDCLPVPEMDPLGGDEPHGSLEDVQAINFETSTNPTFYEEAESPDATSFPPMINADRETGEYAEKIIRHIDVDVEEAPSVGYIIAKEQAEKPALVKLERAAKADDDLSSEGSAQLLKEIEAEIAKFKRVVQTNPHSAFAWDALGTLYKSASLYKEAIFAYQQAISIDSPKASYYYHLGLAYAAEGRNEDTITALQKVVELDPEYSLAHATLGGYYRKMGLEELAQQHIGKAMKNIYDSESEYNRACLEAICGNVDQAIELLRVALKNKQTYVEWVIHDPDLDFIRQDPRFKQLISDYTR